MKKYADRKENFIFKKNETLNDVLKDKLLRAFMFEKVLNESQNKLR